MAKRRNEYIGGGIGSILSGAWGVYSTLTAVRDLPDNASWLAQMIVDPPIYAPWLLFAICVIFLGWIFWHRGENDSSEGDTTTTQTTSGNNSPNIAGVFHGPVTVIGEQQNYFGKPKFAMTDEILEAALQTIDSNKPVTVAWKANGAAMGNRLVKFLKSRGVTVDFISFLSHAHAPEQPVTYLKAGIPEITTYQTVYIDPDA